MRETKMRSFVKSLVWRAFGIVILGGLAWWVTGDLGQTTTITIIFHAIRVVTYYYHERIWDKVKWGQIQ